MLSRQCLFCERSLRGVRAREHIFPRWLIEFMGIKSLPIRSEHHVRSGGSLERKDVRDAPPIARTEGRVCAACNNGWMSALETTAMPVLKPLIEGTSNLYSCKGEEGAIIGRWAAKTAYVLNAASAYPLKVPQSHRVSILNGMVPSEVFVFGFPFSTEELQWSQHTEWRFLNARVDELPSEDELEERTYKIGIRLRHLSLLVVWNGLPGWIVVAPRSWPLLVQPRSYRTIDDEYPPGAFMLPVVGLSFAMTQVMLSR
jgi:hypothetical protein